MKLYPFLASLLVAASITAQTVSGPATATANRVPTFVTNKRIQQTVVDLTTTGGMSGLTNLFTALLSVTNAATVGGLRVNTNAAIAGIVSADTGVLTNGATIGTATIDATGNAAFNAVTGDSFTSTNDITVGRTLFGTNSSITNLFYDTATGKTNIVDYHEATTFVAGNATGSGSVVFSTAGATTNQVAWSPAVTWGLQTVTQTGGTNYTLDFSGGTNAYQYLSLTMTGNVCFAFSTNRAAGRGRTVILHGGAGMGLYFNSDHHLVGTLANGFVVTNTHVLTFFSETDEETGVFAGGQYAE